MAKTTKNNFQPKKGNNYKKVIRMEEGGNLSELNYSERKAYIEQNYAPFITEAQMIFTIFNSGIEYDFKSDRKNVVESIVDSYKKLGDYTESSLPLETNYEIQDWSLVRKDIDPETDEIIVFNRSASKSPLPQIPPIKITGSSKQFSRTW